MEAREQLTNDTDLFWTELETHVGDLYGDILVAIVDVNGTPDQQARASEIYQRKMAELLSGEKEVRVAS